MRQRFSLGRLCRLLAFVFGQVTLLTAQTALDVNEGLVIDRSSVPGMYDMRWYGRPGRTYFVQTSETLMPDSWAYIPVIETGTGSVIEWSFANSAPRAFMRLKWLDGYDAGASGAKDTDRDGISDLDELISGNDPFEEPEPETASVDSDGDGLSDDMDMVPYDPLFNDERSPASRFYAAFDLGRGQPWKMKASGLASWRDGAVYYAWPYGNGATVQFTQMGVESLLGMGSAVIDDLSEDGRVTGRVTDNQLLPHLYTYWPGSGGTSIGPAPQPNIGAAFAANRYGPRDSLFHLFKTSKVINGKYEKRDRIAGDGLYPINPLHDMVVEFKPPQAEADPPPNPQPGESIRIHAGIQMNKTIWISNSGPGGMITHVMESRCNAYDQWTGNDSGDPISPERVLNSATYNLAETFLWTASGASLLLDSRSHLNHGQIYFSSISTHLPMPWLSGSGYDMPEVGTLDHPDHIWLPKLNGYVRCRLYGSAENHSLNQPLPSIFQVNGKGVCIVSGYMQDGSYQFGVWANGQVTSLTDMLSAETRAQYHHWYWNLSGVSDRGTILARAQRLSDNSTRTLLLVPGEVVAGELGTAAEIKDAWLTTAARPTPVVKMYVVHAQPTASGVQVRVRGTVSDELSGLAEAAGDRVQSLKFSVFGQTIRTISLGSGVGTGQSFDQTLLIPYLQATSYTLRAETSENKAGEVGWDEVAVSVGYTGGSFTADSGNDFRVSLTEAPTASVVDTVTVSLGSSAPPAGSGVLTETGADTQVFQGTVSQAGQAVPCTVEMRPRGTLDPMLMDRLDIKARFSPSSGLSPIAATLEESAPDSRLFILSAGSLSGTRGTLEVQATTNLTGAQTETGLTPFTVRLQAAPGLEAGATLVLGDTEFQLQAFEHQGEEYLYPVDAGKSMEPRRFLAATGPVPENLTIPGYTPSTETQTLQFKLRFRGQLSPFLEVQIQPGRVAEEAHVAALASDGGLNAQAGQAWRQPGDKITHDDLMIAFRLMYGDAGQNLLHYFEEGGGVIQLGDVLGDLDIDVLTLDQKTYIQIEDDDAEVAGTRYHPGVAAQLLWNGLHQCLAYHHIRVNIPVTDLNALIQAREAVGLQACQIGIAAAELYLSGISIVSDGADIVLVINEVGEGNYVALAAALPFIPVALFHSSSRLLIKNSAGRLLGKVDNAQELEILQQIYRITDPEEKLHTLGTVLDSNDFGLAIGRIMTSGNGAIKVPTRQQTLADRMKKLVPKPSALHHAHHDLIWEEVEWFADHGIDVNNVAFGRWVDDATHKLWHRQMTPKFNDFWKEFIQIERNGGPRYSKQQILDKLAEARSIYSIETP